MKFIKTRTHKVSCVIIFLVFSICMAKLFELHHNPNSYNNKIGHLEISTTEQWLNNNDFSTQEAWYYSKGNSGDNSTVEAFIDQGSANIRIIGEEQFHEFSDSLNDGTWNRTKNENFEFPNQFAENRSYGLYVSHDYNEAVNQTHQYHSVHWKKIINTGLDMSKYTIIDATLDVIYNATVSTNLEVLGEGSRYTVGDFARFYVYISDIGETNRFRVAYNRTVSLGYNSSYTTILDTILETVGKNDLIQALESAFEKDLFHSMALITIGIDVYCEDNEGSDRDTFSDLLIKSLNLTFSSVRSIERFTAISWHQIGDKIVQDNIQIIQAKFGFSHKIDQLWPSVLSPFTEIRIYLNDNQFKNTVQLSSLNNTFQEAKIGGFDVTNLIIKNVNISVSIQLFIANNFGLDSNRTISLDDAYLYINYILIEPETNMLPLIIGLSTGIAGVTLIFILYQTHFRYPAKVRKIRKLKKKIRKGKKTKLIQFNHRNDIINNKFQDSKNILKLEQEQLAKSKQINKIQIFKEGDK